MMYSSKQKLAMAMAATMVAGMVPAMAFAAEKDVAAVLVELNKEDVTKTNAKDYASAKAALAAAKAVQGTDADAMTIVAAYEASINVLESADAATWTANKTAYDAAVVAVKAANAKVDFSGSFESKNTKDNHQKKFDELSGITSVDGKVEVTPYGTEVHVDLKAPVDLTKASKVMVDGVEVASGTGFWQHFENANVLVVDIDPKTTAVITFEYDGKAYRVNL